MQFWRDQQQPRHGLGPRSDITLDQDIALVEAAGLSWELKHLD